MTGHARRPTIITSPDQVPAGDGRPCVFLGGSIDMGNAPDWQAELIAALAREDVLVLNPRRANWNAAWQPDAADPNFRMQVEWELSALERADIIVLYFAPGSLSPVSLLEMGLHARSGKLILLCPDGFWRKGNVDITAERFGLCQVASMTALVEAVGAKVAALRKGNGW